MSTGQGFPRQDQPSVHSVSCGSKSLRSTSLRKCLLLGTFKNKFFLHNRSLGEGKSPQAGICESKTCSLGLLGWVVCGILQVVDISTSSTHRAWPHFSRGAQDNRSCKLNMHPETFSA